MFFCGTLFRSWVSQRLNNFHMFHKVGNKFVLMNMSATIDQLLLIVTWPVQLYLQDDKLVETVPCILTTNLRTGSADLLAFLKRIHSPSVDKWFVHW